MWHRGALRITENADGRIQRYAVFPVWTIAFCSDWTFMYGDRDFEENCVKDFFGQLAGGGYEFFLGETWE